MVIGTTAEELRAQYLPGELVGRVEGALRAAGLDPGELDPRVLVELEGRGTGDREALRRLAEAARIGPGDHVLDVGAGIGATARSLAVAHGCRVTALDLVADLCAVSEALTARSGLSDLVTVRRGNATDLHVADGSFDVVWTQEVAVNVEDKHAFYTEVRRVLRPGGRLACREVVAGGAGAPHLPVPWATIPSQSFLEAPEVVRRLLVATGLRPVLWEVDDGDGGREVPDPDAPLGPACYLADARTRIEHLRRNLVEGRVRFLLAVCEAV